MAIIMDEWKRINAVVDRLSKRFGIGVPQMLRHLEGDMYRRQGARLAALRTFLEQVERKAAAEAKAKDTPDPPGQVEGDKPKTKPGKAKGAE